MRTSGKWSLVLWMALAHPGAGSPRYTDYDGFTWADHPIVFNVDLSARGSASAPQATLTQAVLDAGARWNGVLGLPYFQFRPVAPSTAQTLGNGWNEIYFTPGSSLYLATTVTVRGQADRVVEADIPFISNQQWMYYHGPLVRDASGVLIPDMYRISLHEMGHVLGLSHPVNNDRPTIMRSHQSDIDDLTEEDIRDGRLVVLHMFRKNAPRIDAPRSAELVTTAREFVLRGTGRSFFTATIALKIDSPAGRRLRHVRISSHWSRRLVLMPGTNRIRFSYRLPYHGRVQFATKVITVR